MDVMGYRNSGELSDITVVIDGEEFHLHKFPLFVRSEYFRNLSPDTQKVVLDNFPGGQKVFAIVADYCYNKEVQIDAENVIEVLCASEYLKMSGGIGRSGLSIVANNILFDITYAGRNKREYKQSLKFVQKAAEFADIIETSGAYKKVIDSFIESLVSFVKLSGIYESINIYCKSHKSTAMNKKNLHDLVIDEDQFKILNDLPLKWINDILRTAVRNGLNHGLISYIIQNYIDSNTKLNDSYNKDIKKKQSKQNDDVISKLNLVKITSDVLKLAGTDSEEPKKSSNLLDIAGDILAPKSPNLISMASDILKTENKLAGVIQNANEDDDTNSYADEAEPDGGNLKGIMGDILAGVSKKLSKSEEEEEEETATNTEKDSETEESSNLVNIAGDILAKEDAENIESSNLVNIAGDIIVNAASDEKPNANLLNIAGDILVDAASQDKEETSQSNLIKITGDIFNITGKIEKLTQLIPEKPKRELSDEEKLEVIKSLTNVLIDMRLEPHFPIVWLVNYMEALNKLRAESYLKAAFSRWAWNVISEMKGNSSDLVEVPPSSMVQLANDVLNDSDCTKSDINKLLDVIDRYINELNNESLLDSETLLQVASSVPKEKRTNFDELTNVILSVLEKEHGSIDEEAEKKLFDLIDFSKINEKTLDECKDCQFVPHTVVTEAALSLCAKLRKELNEVKLLNKSYEIKSRPLVMSSEHVPSYTSAYTTKYRSPSRNKTTATDSLLTESRAVPSSYTTTPIITRNSRLPSAASTYRKPVSPAARDSTYTKTSSPQRDSVYRSISSSRQYTKTTSPSINTSPSILNSAYKSSNFNPSTVYSHHKTPTSADYRHSMYLDYMSDDGMYDYTNPSSNAQNYLDDGEYYCSNHHHNYQYYSRIF